MENKNQIPVGWRRIKLGQCLSEISDRNNTSSGNGAPVLSVTNRPGFSRSEEHFDKKVFSKNLSNYKCISRGQFAYNPSRVDVGSIARLKEVNKGLLSPMYVTFKTDNGLNAAYLEQWILSARFRNLVKAGTQGSVRNSLNFSALQEFQFDLPPELEQIKIVSILESIDYAISCTYAVIEQVKNLKKGIMQELLTCGIPGKHKAFKRSKIGKMPADWKITSVKASCEILDNKRIPLKEEERRLMEGDIPYWGPTGPIDYINKFIFDEKSEIVLIGEDGDHFMKWRTWPMAFIVKGKCWVNNHVHILRGKEDCTNKWIWRYFEHKDLFPYLNISGSRTRMKLNQGALEAIQFPLPSLGEQLKIVNVLDTLDGKLATEQNLLQLFIKQKIALARALFAGEIRVKLRGSTNG